MKLSSITHFPATSFVSLLGVLCATVFMDVTGGGLKPYEMQTARAVWGSVIGDASAAEALSDSGPVRVPRWRTQMRLAEPPVVRASTADAPGADLLGGEELLRPFQPAPLELVQTDIPGCRPGVQWTSATFSRDTAT